MKPPTIRTETGKVAASMLAGWGLDWADTIAAIEDEAIAIALGPTVRAEPDGEIPVGIWFRLRWPAGRIGRWHRAGRRLPHLSQQFCRCWRGVVGYTGRRHAEIATETSTETPPFRDRCNAWRKAAALRAVG